jgi:hypothetical protein
MGCPEISWSWGVYPAQAGRTLEPLGSSKSEVFENCIAIE